MGFSPKQTKWLKCFHLLAVTGWAGGAFSLLLLHFLRFKGFSSGNDLYGIDRASHLVDMGVIVILGATGCFVTGLLYSIFTNWGFFRHRWIMVKWIITIFCILFGTFFLGPWETTMVNISRELGNAALRDEKYISSMYLNFWFGLLQIILIIFVTFISVFKPWRRNQRPKPA